MTAVRITINGKQCAVESDRTILQAAQENDIHIPTLCHFEGITDKANCRLCVVEVEGMRTFQPACVTKVRDGMVIKTDTEKLRAARKATLQLIMAHHAIDCHHCLRIGSSSEQSLDPKFCEMCFWCDCERDGFCELQKLNREYHVDVLPYIQHEADYQIDDSLQSVTRNPNKCIKCRRCVEVCGKVQTVHNLSMANRGHEIMIVPELGRSMADSACVRCGHCIDVCPVGAIVMKEHKDEVLYRTHSYDVNTVCQLSGNVIRELTDLYHLEESAISMNQICTALHKIGFDKVVTDEYSERESEQQAVQIIEKRTGNDTIILTSSHAVMNFVDEYFAEMKNRISFYENSQTIFGRTAGRNNAFGFDKPVKTVNITNVKEMGAEAEETGNVDYVWNARELYRVFLR
ncbi:MAG: 2Fe-2S iron-sulfur cluster-binding protein, partial [Bulleidia sp.]